jgi:ribosome maturation protein Sdo1
MIKEKKYLTDEESENLKAACKTDDERSIVRELLETGSTLDDVLRNKRARAGFEKHV